MNSHTSERNGDKYGSSGNGIRFSPNIVELFLREHLAKLAGSFDSRIKPRKSELLPQKFFPSEWEGYIDGIDKKHNPKGLVNWFCQKYPDKEFHIRTEETSMIEFEVFRKNYKQKKFFE